MRLATSIDVVYAAENAMKTIIDTYLAPNRLLREIDVLAGDGRMNFLHDFGEVCRVELAMQEVTSGSENKQIKTTQAGDVHPA
jgi:hypothetical protein